MTREASANGGDTGRRDPAGKNAWDKPRLTTIDIQDAQSSVTFASDGLYAVS